MLLTSLVVTQFVHYAYAFSIPPLPGLSHFVGASHTQTQQQPLQDTFDAWIEREERIALDKLLANIAPGGSNVEGKGVSDGTVVASPSQDKPDYWYQCEFCYACYGYEYSLTVTCRGSRCRHNNGHARARIRG